MTPEPLYLSPTSAPQVIANLDAFGFLASPRTSLRSWIRDGAWWAMDNDAFNGGLDETAWLVGVEKHRPYLDRCLFAVVPDVVYDAAATLERFNEYAPLLPGYPLALATQNGMTPKMVPWDDIAALFIGGDDKHKLGPEAGALMAEARRRGKWVHVGRVNSVKRLLKFWRADSWDGTTISREPQHAIGIARTVREIRQMRRNGGFEWFTTESKSGQR